MLGLLERFGHDVVLIEQRRTAEHDELVERCGGDYVFWNGERETLPSTRVCGINLYPPTRLPDGTLRAGLRVEERDRAVPVLIEWLRERMRGQPMVVVVDEGWAVLKHPAGAAFAEEMARTGRGDFVSFWLATQQIAEILSAGRAVFDNAAVRVLLKQRDRDLDAIVDAAGISGEVRSQLESAERGTAFVDWNGTVVKMQAQALPSDHAWLDTDPRRGADDDEIGEDNHADDRERAGAVLVGVGAGATGATVPADAADHRRNGRRGTGGHRPQ